MESIYDNYQNTIRARMNNLIGQYAQPPPIYHHSVGPIQNPILPVGPINYPSQQLHYTLPARTINNSQINSPMFNDHQMTNSPALDRIAKNISEIVIDVNSPIILENDSVPKSSMDSFSFSFNIFCWMLGLTLLVVLGWTIYLAVTLFYDNKEECEEDEF